MVLPWLHQRARHNLLVDNNLRALPNVNGDELGLLGVTALSDSGAMLPRVLDQTRILCVARPPSFPPWQGGMKGGLRYVISKKALIQLNSVNRDA